MASDGGISLEAYAARIRFRCLTDLEFFSRYFFKATKARKFLVAEHHTQIFDRLTRLHDGQYPGLITNIPPRHSKTELTHIMFPAWAMAKNPGCEFLHLSYSQELAHGNSDRVREIMTHPAYVALFPKSRIRADRRARHHWKTEAGGAFFAGAAGGTVTGMGAGNIEETEPGLMLGPVDAISVPEPEEWEAQGIGGRETDRAGRFKFCGAILIDDPLKPDDARSDAKRESVNRRWEETIKSRRNGARTPVVLTMQRLGVKDFTAELLSDRSIDWHHLIMPAILDEGLETERALWPEKLSLAALKASRDRVNDRGEPNPLAQATFRAQYQQQPGATEGSIIKTHWWRFRDPGESINYAYTIVTADTAYTAKTANDPSVLQIWGLGREALHLIDEVRGWWEFPELIKRAQEIYQRADRCNGLFIEAKASGLSLVQTLRQAGVKALPWSPASFNYPADKVGRLKEASWHVHAGKVILPGGPDHPISRGLIEECMRFTETDTHEYDDRVDSFTMATSVWSARGGGR